MKKIRFDIWFLIIGIILIILSIIIPITKDKTRASQFYNVVYHTGDISIEYHDVTNLYYDNIGVYFTTSDSTTVILNGGAIEIIPLDLD